MNNIFNYIEVIGSWVSCLRVIFIYVACFWVFYSSALFFDDAIKVTRDASEVLNLKRACTSMEEM
jgi:hypothetical protein